MQVEIEIIPLACKPKQKAHTNVLQNVKWKCFETKFMCRHVRIYNFFCQDLCSSHFHRRCYGKWKIIPFAFIWCICIVGISIITHLREHFIALYFIYGKFLRLIHTTHTQIYKRKVNKVKWKLAAQHIKQNHIHLFGKSWNRKLNAWSNIRHI